MAPIFFKRNRYLKKIIFSVFVDTAIYPIPFLPVMLFYIGLVTHKGKFKLALRDVKNQYWKVYFTSFGFYPFK